MAEEKPKPSRDGAKGITHREPKGVSKPRVGNPWRDMQGGTIGAPTMRVHGGAPSGAGVPTWQADGARGGWYSPAQRESEDTSGALDASSVRRAYGVGVPEAVEFSSELRPHYRTVFDGRAVGRSFGVERQHGESTAGVSALDAPVALGPRIVHPVVSRMERFVATVMAAAEAACVEWETLRATAMDAGEWELAASHRTTADYFRADKVRAHLVCEETVALARELYPDSRGTRARQEGRPSTMFDGRPFPDSINPASPAQATRRDAVSWETAHDPGVSARRAVSALAPMAHGAIRTGDARRGIETGIPTTAHSRAVHPCAWCDSVACDRARNPVLPCPVYDRAASRGNPLVTQYQKAVNAHKAPKGAYREATAWAESLRATAVQRLHALDAQGADIDPSTAPRGIPCVESLRAGRWRTITAMKPLDYKGFTSDPARLAQRVDHALSYLADAEFAREAVARIGSTGVSAELRDDAAAIVAAMAPAGVWWATPLRAYRVTAGALGAATLALSSALRAARDETIARRSVSRHQTPGRVAPGVDGDARAESVTLVSPVAPPKRPPEAPRTALPRAVPPPATRPREYRGDAPLVDTRPGPVTRPGEARTDPPARTPMGAPLDAPIEELRARIPRR